MADGRKADFPKPLRIALAAAAVAGPGLAGGPAPAQTPIGDPENPETVEANRSGSVICTLMRAVGLEPDRGLPVIETPAYGQVWEYRTPPPPVIIEPKVIERIIVKVEEPASPSIVEVLADPPPHGTADRRERTRDLIRECQDALGEPRTTGWWHPMGVLMAELATCQQRMVIRILGNGVAGGDGGPGPAADRTTRESREQP